MQLYPVPLFVSAPGSGGQLKAYFASFGPHFHAAEVVKKFSDAVQFAGIVAHAFLWIGVSALLEETTSTQRYKLIILPSSVICLGFRISVEQRLELSRVYVIYLWGLRKVS